MPPYYAEDAATLAVVDAVARELDRVEGLLTALRDGAFPQRADDVYRTLGLWESLVGLPVEPEGETLASRRNKVLGFRYRAVRSGEDWVQALTAALGTTNWSYVEEAGRRVLITLPYVTGSYDASTVAALARKITPAHIEVVGTYSQGFLIGISALGEQAL